ncbi:MAG: HAMP domain-containing protein [Desulfobacterales bacterium]|jgi:two-component system NtrC family sensor kinase|nr:HAMP domain-containing protein [Desulfobacterales bacterium]
MKLTIKIMGLIFLGIIALLAVDGYITVKREINLFDNDMKQNAFMLGNTVKELTIGAWHESGRNRALELIKKVDKEENHMRIQWVWLGGLSSGPYMPHVALKKLTAVFNGHEISVKKTDDNGPGYRYTYIPVKISNNAHGALEISESLAELTGYVHKTIFRSIILGILMALLGFIMLWVLGIKFVGRPLNQMMAFTRQIGEGDFSKQIVVHGHDELSNLATAMNQMCEQLAASREAVRKETEARIAALEQLRHTERLATLGRLSSGIAHELGTPLNVVSGRAKLIIHENLNKQDIVECSRIIKEQAERMAKLIRQLLDFARRRAPQKSWVDLRNLSAQVMEMLTPSAKKQNVIIDLLKKEDIPLVPIDPYQIQQVLINLVLNGIQAMPEGGHLELGIHMKYACPPAQNCSPKQNYAVIYIKDEGSGIPEEHINHIFEPFFTTKSVGQGTGLGLSISYGIVQEHGGWIDVQSNVGKGSCFTIYIPLEVDQCAEKS